MLAPKPLPPLVAQPPVPSFGELLKQGLGFGLGQAVAHRAVASVLNPSQTPSKKVCEKELVAFESCLKTRAPDVYCGNEQTAYTHCVEVSKHSSE